MIGAPMTGEPGPRIALAALEAAIARGFTSSVEVGTALLEIRESRLHHEGGFDRFEDYCQERWGFSRPQAYRMIDSAKGPELVPRRAR
jgi:hypothetical protein